jgi:hypothetical protein
MLRHLRPQKSSSKLLLGRPWEDYNWDEPHELGEADLK